MVIKIPKSTEVTTLNIANIHTTGPGKWQPTAEVQMGMARLAQFDGELVELAINATNFGQNATVKALALTVLVSFFQTNRIGQC